MTLNQLLKQNQSFYGASVIAAEDDLDREVKSVMVLEAADIENWGKPDQQAPVYAGSGFRRPGAGIPHYAGFPPVPAARSFSFGGIKS